MITPEQRARNYAHKLARKLVPTMEKCEACGETRGLQRHHPDYFQPTRIEILCRKCHILADQRDGYAPKKQRKACKVCGKMFLPTHTKNHSTCSRECLTEIGRRNAEKRWTAYYASGKKPLRIRNTSRLFMDGVTVPKKPSRGPRHELAM